MKPWLMGLGLIVSSVFPVVIPPLPAMTQPLCTPSIEPGIKVTIVEAKTKRPLEAEIVIQAENFQEKLSVFGVTAAGQTLYGGAFERPGTYTVTVRKSGYRPVVLKDVQVGKNECHVETNALQVQLEKVQPRPTRRNPAQRPR